MKTQQTQLTQFNRKFKHLGYKLDPATTESYLSRGFNFVLKDSKKPFTHVKAFTSFEEAEQFVNEVEEACKQAKFELQLETVNS